jgi:hypothetical protein
MGDRPSLTEREKMIGGELYDPFDPELVRSRARARHLCQELNATRESQEHPACRITKSFGSKLEGNPSGTCDAGRFIWGSLLRSNPRTLISPTPPTTDRVRPRCLNVSP